VAGKSSEPIRIRTHNGEVTLELNPAGGYLEASAFHEPVGIVQTEAIE
jgi:hypothetical protein